ncbi:RING-H2 finger protein ATL60-like [Musa acuminata AAA Group]|uniref:RING-H2 finger protein ATL60-like n=1 Tax=Musa acuminata AAA Group TaxID=214697 RepID=UPI0031D9CFA3
MIQTEQSVIGLGGLHLATSTGFIVAAVIVFFIFFIFVLLLCLRAKRHRDANHVFPTEPAAVVAQRPCLQAAAAIEALPSMVFRCEGYKQGVECAVCLGELSEGEEARLLIGCNHAFHLQCIDMWFCSHSTCPLCRSPVVLDTPEPANSGAESSPLSSSGCCAVVAEIAVRHEGSRHGLQ